MPKIDGFHIVEIDRDKFHEEEEEVALAPPIHARHTHSEHIGSYYAGYSDTQLGAHVWRCLIDGCPITITKLCPVYFGHYDREKCNVCS